MKSALLEKETNEKPLAEMSENEMFIRKIVRAVMLTYPNDWKDVIEWFTVTAKPLNLFASAKEV